VLVVHHATNTRERVCLAGRRAAGDRSHWFEAADADAASWTLAFSEIDLVLADTHSFQHGVQGWMDCAAAACSKPAPLVVVLSDDSGPHEIQQMLDAGAECCLPKHLPQGILENELRWLVAQARRKALPS
jgi:DNA-binding NarL/FixJ family response regulator